MLNEDEFVINLFQFDLKMLIIHYVESNRYLNMFELKEDFLYEYGSYVNEWVADGKTVYTYFNNTMGDAIENLVTLRDMVQPG